MRRLANRAGGSRDARQDAESHRDESAVLDPPRLAAGGSIVLPSGRRVAVQLTRPTAGDLHEQCLAARATPQGVLVEDVPVVTEALGPPSSWPQWSAPIAREAVPGEDQLGVEGAAQGYQQYLVPGIITTTEHARYYGFYTWILHRFIHLPGSSRLLRDFKGEFFRRHEVALILGYYGHHLDASPISGMVGAGINDSKARKYWESGSVISLDQPYFQNTLGGFGQYYRAAMEALRLIAQNEKPRLVYKLTERGKALAEAYAESIKSTAYARDLEHNASLPEITRGKARSYGKVGCVCPESLQNGKDLPLLLDAFFRFDQTGVSNG